MLKTAVVLLAIIATVLAYWLWEERETKKAVAEAQFHAYYQTQVAPEVREQEYRARKDGERADVDALYRERRAKEREVKIAEFNSDPAKVLKHLKSLIQSKSTFDEACAMAADHDGVVDDALRRLTQSIETKVGVKCSNQ